MSDDDDSVPNSEVEDEPNADGEPDIRWRNSLAKKLLEKDIVEGRVPLQARPRTMSLKEIYVLRPEFSEYSYKRFSSRLSSLRATLKTSISRAASDEVALANFVLNHGSDFPIGSLYSHKGYIQWQGSQAQRFLKEDLENGVLDDNEMTKMQLWSSRPEYYETFPLDVFRDKVNQTVRTKKYLHTVKVKGKFHKAS